MSEIQMRILYIKRAYNTRLHNQVRGLLQRGHEITLLLDSPIEYGYNGPGQWDSQDIRPDLKVCYTGIVKSGQTRIHKINLLRRACRRLLQYRNRLLGMQRHLGMDAKGIFMSALDRVLRREDVDLILSSNDALETEDMRTEWLIEAWKGKIPIVYECQDILSDCFSGNAKVEETERFVNEESDGVIHTNPLALEWMTGRYHIKKATYFPNFAGSQYFRVRLPKLSGEDGSIHLVYCGSVQKTPKQYPYPFARDMKNMFREIAALGFPLHLHLGFYPDTPEYKYYMELKNFPNIHLYGYLPFAEMMQKLSRYDIGLFPIDLGSLKKQVELFGPVVLSDFPLSRADTSKQYEYTLAGLPILTAPLTWLSMWLEENNFGTSFDSVSHLNKILKNNHIKEYSKAVEKDAFKFSMEENISSLEKFLWNILN